MLAWLIFSIITFGTTISLYDLTNQRNFFTVLQWLLYILISFAFIPTILVFIRLRQKGTSKELRNKVFWRHTVYFMIYMMVMMQAVMDTHNFEIIDLWENDEYQPLKGIEIG